MKKLLSILLFLVAVASLEAQQFSKDKFLLGDKVQTEHEEYYLLLDVLAKIKGANNQQATGQSAGQAVGLGAGEQILKQKHVYQIYQTFFSRVQDAMQASTQQFTSTQAASGSSATSQSTNREKNFLVAWNDRTKDFAIITGSILIQLRDFSDAETLISDYNLLETHRFPKLNNLLIVKTSLDELVKKVRAIQADARVQMAELEILENFQIPQ